MSKLTCHIHGQYDVREEEHLICAIDELQKENERLEEDNNRLRATEVIAGQGSAFEQMKENCVQADKMRFKALQERNEARTERGDALEFIRRIADDLCHCQMGEAPRFCPGCTPVEAAEWFLDDRGAKFDKFGLFLSKGE